MGLYFSFCQGIKAHNPLSARYYLESKDKTSILNIYLSDHGLYKALLKTYGKEKISSLSSKAYKELIIEYLKNNFFLEINKTKIQLLEGGIKLGNHQTDVKFLTSAIPDKIKTITIEIKAFKENNNHQTIFDYDIAGVKDKVILSKKNNYYASITYEDVEENTISIYFYGILIGLVVVGVLVFAFRLKKKNS